MFNFAGAGVQPPAAQVFNMSDISNDNTQNNEKNKWL
jgi:hypothetical protein